LGDIDAGKSRLFHDKLSQQFCLFSPIFRLCASAKLCSDAWILSHGCTAQRFCGP
jgi:hypothetical protein